MTTIELEDEQAAALTEISRRERRPVSDVLGELIAARLGEPRDKPEPPASIRHDPVLSAAFGAWKGLFHEDAVDYQRRLRAEWDR